MEKDKTEIFIYSRKSKWTGRGERCAWQYARLLEDSSIGR